MCLHFCRDLLGAFSSILLRRQAGSFSLRLFAGNLFCAFPFGKLAFPGDLLALKSLFFETLYFCLATCFFFLQLRRLPEAPLFFGFPLGLGFTKLQLACLFLQGTPTRLVIVARRQSARIGKRRASLSVCFGCMHC